MSGGGVLSGFLRRNPGINPDYVVRIRRGVPPPFQGVFLVASATYEFWLIEPEFETRGDYIVDVQ